jgi:sulfopyruvate decarboxylase TPP-binding subunit
MSQSAWQAQVYAELKQAHISQVSYVPDAGHAPLIEAAQADPAMRAVVLTTEEEGIALPLAPGWAASVPCC